MAGVKPMPRLVAYVYADHARQRRDAWVPISRLIERTGMSESTVIRSRKSLVSDGWLVEMQGASQHRAALFAFVIPEAFRPVTATPLEDPDLSERLPRPVTPTAQTCQSDTQSISDQSKNQSLSPDQRVLMQLLDCAADDERVDAGIRLIAARQPAKPASWLRAVHSNGDLEDLIANEMKPDTRRIPGRDYWDNGGTFFDKPSPSRTTPSIEHIICTGVLDDGSTCAQPIHPNRRDRPCIVCGQINRPTFKDVNAS
ncbi:hypothetical protein HMPREF0321_1493 [Dermacoccus sp. Ellin185]|nr:hypothetical protein HMPREF0321_1493 [Dermacoccus sp. Ellin185]